LLPSNFEDFQDIDAAMLQDDSSSEQSSPVELEEAKPFTSTSKLLDDIYDIHLAELP